MSEMPSERALEILDELACQLKFYKTSRKAKSISLASVSMIYYLVDNLSLERTHDNCMKYLEGVGSDDFHDSS